MSEKNYSREKTFSKAVDIGQRRRTFKKITILQKNKMLDLGKIGLLDRFYIFLKIHFPLKGSNLLFVIKRLNIYIKERRLPDIKSILKNLEKAER